MNILGLVQLCQAVEPASGYADTLCIERLSDSEQLAATVETMLESTIAPSGGVASGIAYRSARGGAFEEFPALCSVMSSPQVPADLRRASVQMGQRLWGVSRGWGWAASVHDQLDIFMAGADMHHAVAFGALVSETTSSQARGIATYLFNVARNLIMAAIPLDEMEGQRILAKVQPRITDLALRCVDKNIGDIRVLN